MRFPDSVPRHVSRLLKVALNEMGSPLIAPLTIEVEIFGDS
jgi:hypothetical protein